MRPFPKETLKSLREYYRVGLTYMICQKREAFRVAFERFDFEKVARYRELTLQV